MKQHNYLSDINFLLVDDNAFIRSILRRILEPFGATKIREAPDGTEAIKVMNNWSADIVLTDWVMAPLDGIEFTKIVRNSQNLGHCFVPIIVVSAHSENWRIAEARDAGVTEYVLKPVSAKKILSRVRKVIEEPRAFIRAPGYFGPDRRRRQVNCAVERRASSPTEVTPADALRAPDIDMTLKLNNAAMPGTAQPLPKLS